MKRSVCLLLTLVVLLIMSSCDRDQRKAKNWNDKTLADLDAIKFIRGGITGGLMEIKAANLAKTRSSNPRVINFANMMIADHTQIGNELKKMESDKMLDKDKNLISDEHQSMLSELAAKSGSAFDKAYMGMMVSDHQEDIELFNSATHNTSATIQKLAEKTLPTLQMHLDSAKAINASLK